MNTQNNFIDFNVDQSEDGYRLDLFLSFKLPNLSRSFIKKIIEDNKVLLNGLKCFKPAYKVKFNDIISFPVAYLKNNEVTQKLNINNYNYDDLSIQILYEDHDYLVINKPVGVKVHKTDENDPELSLIDRIIYMYKIKLPGENMRPGIVHRLDKGTSGVFVIAKNPKSLWWLSRQFAERKVDKYYVSIGLALSKKNFNQSCIKVEGYMRRSYTNRKLFIFQKNKNILTDTNFKYSLSYFYHLETKFIESSFLTLFLIQPKTGRTHQIRVHQKFLETPILGDNLYLSSKLWHHSYKLISLYNLNARLFLHAYSIKFYNYDGVSKMFTANIPSDFLIFFNDAEQKINSLQSIKNK